MNTGDRHVRCIPGGLQEMPRKNLSKDCRCLLLPDPVCMAFQALFGQVHGSLVQRRAPQIPNPNGSRTTLTPSAQPGNCTQAGQALTDDEEPATSQSGSNRTLCCSGRSTYAGQDQTLHLPRSRTALPPGSGHPRASGQPRFMSLSLQVLPGNGRSCLCRCAELWHGWMQATDHALLGQ